MVAIPREMADIDSGGYNEAGIDATCRKGGVFMVCRIIGGWLIREETLPTAPAPSRNRHAKYRRSMR
jgi:hypothetical protein